MSPTSNEKDWHRNYQDEDYISLLLQRLEMIVLHCIGAHGS
jgi:hypothetical protein